MSQPQEVVVKVAPSFPVLGLLGTAFVILKLCGVIGWSWWWVTVPFWGPLALVLAGLSVFAAGALVVLLIAALVSKFSR